MRALLAVAALLGGTTTANAATYDIVADFGAPVFSYGTLSAAGGFTAFAHEPNFGRCHDHPEWNCFGGTEDYHHVAHTYGDVVPGTILLHTGPVSNVVLRFTAPTAGTYGFVGTAMLYWPSPFAFGDGTQEYFHQSSDPARLTYAADTTVAGQVASLSATFILAAGESADIVSDKGANYYYDDTLFTGSFTGGVPEPATWAMLIAGFGLTGAMARRRSLGEQRAA